MQESVDLLLPPGVVAEDEGDLEFGFRALFPQSFGQQLDKDKTEEPLELRHAATRRPPSLVGAVANWSSQSKKEKNANGKAQSKKGGIRIVLRGTNSISPAGSSQPTSRLPDSLAVVRDTPTPEAAPEAETSRSEDARRRSGSEAGRASQDFSTDAGPAMSQGVGAAGEEPKDDSWHEVAGDARDVGFVGPQRPPEIVPAGNEGWNKGRGNLRVGGGISGNVQGVRGAVRGGVEEEEEEEGGGGEESEAEDEGEEEGDEDEDEFRVPVSNEVLLQGHTKVVSALAVDPTGSRVLTGSYDYTVRMYDFGGMDSRLQAFRELTPFDGHQVRAVTWSPTADMFFVATGNAQAKVYDRDGRTKGEFVRGDMYIRDMRNTNGHLSGLTCAEWHPSKRHTVLSSSEDGSLRIWDVTDFKKQVQVVKPKLARPGRVPVTTCKWGPGGQMVAAGLNDGSLQIWNVRSGWGSRPDLFLDGAHERGEDISGVLFSGDGSLLISRSTDSTLKVWDVRKFKTPLKTTQNLPNHYGQTNIAWSPDERLFLTGTSAVKGDRGSEIVFFNRQDLEVVRRTGVSDVHSVVRVEWHPRLNQIFATAGDKKGGGTHILYDPDLSERGALLCVARAPRKARPEDVCASVMPPAIHNPHALPLFREPPSRKRQREKARTDPVQSKRPDLPVEGHGHGGRIGTAKGTLLTQYLLREAGMLKETWMEEDPRAAILKYAKAAEEDPLIIAPAYAKTQPKTVYYESDEDKQDDD